MMAVDSASVSDYPMVDTFFDFQNLYKKYQKIFFNLSAFEIRSQPFGHALIIIFFPAKC